MSNTGLTYCSDVASSVTSFISKCTALHLILFVSSLTELCVKLLTPDQGDLAGYC